MNIKRQASTLLILAGVLATGCSKVSTTAASHASYDHEAAMVIASRVASVDTALVVTADSTQSALETNEYNDRIIRTTVSGNVSEVLKGNSAQSHVSFVVDGGIVGTQRMVASDMPESISKGSRFIVLLKASPRGAAANSRLEISGRGNGIMPINSDADLADFKAGLARFK